MVFYKSCQGFASSQLAHTYIYIKSGSSAPLRTDADKRASLTLSTKLYCGSVSGLPSYHDSYFAVTLRRLLSQAMPVRVS